MSVIRDCVLPCVFGVVLAGAARAQAPPKPWRPAAPATIVATADTCETVTPLASTVSTLVSAGHDEFSCNQTDPYWTAVAVRSPANMDVDLYTSPSGGATPVCFSGLHVHSAATATGVEVAVGDFNFNPYGTMYVRARPDTTGTPTGRIQWDSGADPITAGDAPTVRTIDSTFVVECWDLYMQSGTRYIFNMTRSGTADTRLLLFANPKDSTYWAGRGSAVLQLSGGTGECVGSRSGWYGVVVVNENGGAGGYSFSVAEAGTAGVPDGGAARMALRVTPNPLTGAARVRFSTARAARVQLELFDIAARRVRASQERWLEAGNHEWSVDAPGADVPGVLAPGVYLVAVKLDGQLAGARRIVVK